MYIVVCIYKLITYNICTKCIIYGIVLYLAQCFLGFYFNLYCLSCLYVLVCMF